MESAVEALKMAAAVLIFVIAIVSSFSLFGTAKETADSIIRIRDKQAYLQAADLDGGILYTSASEIRGEEYTEDKRAEDSTIVGVTRNGDRIVKLEDVISTIYRYYSEKYGVTIMEKDGTIIARYDSDTERIINTWNTTKDPNILSDYVDLLNKNTQTDYASTVNFNENVLKDLYTIEISGVGTGDPKTVGAPWYGNEEDIKKKIGADLKGETCTYNVHQTYKGIDLISKLGGKRIVEVIKEIDNSQYLKDGEDKTNLIQKYETPTIEVIYIIIN